MLDGRFLLLADSFKRRDWQAAATQIDAIERDQVFAFAVPVLRAWLAQGSGRGDPLAALPAPGGQGLGAAYAAEHRPLLLAVMGRPGAVDELIRAARSAGPRNARLRIAGAALLARRDRAGALRLLDAPGASLAIARRAVEAGRPLQGAIDGPDDALAELLVRLSLDLHGQELTTLAASFVRVATWLSPDNSETWMVAAELLGQQDRARIAVPLLANIRADDPFAATMRDQRIRLLLDGGDREAALAEALAVTRAAGGAAPDWVRLGEVYLAMDRQREAADALARAIALRTDGDDMQAEWVLWLMRGGALDKAGDWPLAREALRHAYRLAPEQPVVLNYLGYAQLIRSEDVEESVRLIREAHRRAPDSAAITDSLGWALYLQGNLAEAIVLLERAAEGEPADVEINEHLGDAYLAAGRRVEARFAWAAALAYAEGEAAARLRIKIDTGAVPRLAAR
jgi:Flp pilus assembly protein TadD